MTLSKIFKRTSRVVIADDLSESSLSKISSVLLTYFAVKEICLVRDASKVESIEILKNDASYSSLLIVHLID